MYMFILQCVIISECTCLYYNMCIIISEYTCLHVTLSFN